MAGFVLFLTFRRNVELFLIILHLTSHQALSSANFSPSVHAFFYLWYGIPEFDDEYLHWNHKVLPHWETSVNDQYPTIGKGHKPPENIHSPYYPLHGPYSTKDPKNLASQFSSMNAAKITVAVLSWWGQPSNINSRDTQGVTSDLVMHDVFHAADKDGQIKLAFHLEPYHSRSVESIRSDIEYIILSYGNYSSILRGKDGRPLFYVYDSYHIDPTQWQRLLSPQGDITVRDTPYDSVFIGLWLESHHGHDLKTGGFDGVYTYFASDGFSYGSSTSNWETISAFSKVNQLLCILSVGPGYEDTSIRPWNAHNSKPRRSVLSSRLLFLI